MSALRQYLNQHAAWMREVRKGSNWKYSSVEDYVVQKGIVFSSAPLTTEELAIIYDAAGHEEYPIKQCFANSQKLVMNDRSNKLLYTEGFASGVIPIHHGWVSINRKVVDLTMRVYEIINGGIEKKLQLHNHKRFKDRVLGILPAGREYVGVTFDREIVLNSMKATMMYQSLIDNWQQHWPLLQGKHDAGTEE